MNPIQLLSEETFKQSFANGLIKLLSENSAGTFILALANSFQQPELFNANTSLIKSSYRKIHDHYQDCHNQGKEPDDAVDDIKVMQSIFQVGLDNLSQTQLRQIDETDVSWYIDFNQLRSFRPARMSRQIIDSINVDFNPDGFHFNKPFLEREVFIEEQINNKTVSLLYNKFPFCDYHGLLVIERDKQINQFLSEELFTYIYQTYFTLSENIPELVFAYNSLAAGASINHLHIQTSITDKDYAIESKCWTHNGGDIKYPANCSIELNLNTAWEKINHYQQANIPFNLIIKRQRLYLLPRKLPNSTDNQDINITWYEMAGNWSFSEQQIFNSFNAEQIYQYLEGISAE